MTISADFSYGEFLSMSFLPTGIPSFYRYPWYDDLATTEIEFPKVPFWGELGFTNPSSMTHPQRLDFYGYEPSLLVVSEKLQKSGEFLSNLRAFFSDWNFHQPAHIARENDVYHENLKGLLRNAASSLHARTRPASANFPEELYPVVTEFSISDVDSAYLLLQAAPSVMTTLSSSWIYGSEAFLQKLTLGQYDMDITPGNGYRERLFVSDVQALRDEDREGLVTDFRFFVLYWNMNLSTGVGYTSGDWFHYSIAYDVSSGPSLDELSDVNEFYAPRLEERYNELWSMSIAAGVDPRDFAHGYSNVGDGLWQAWPHVWGHAHQMTAFFTCNNVGYPDPHGLLGYNGKSYGYAPHDRTFSQFLKHYRPVMPDTPASYFLTSKEAFDEVFDTVSSGAFELLDAVHGIVSLLALEEVLRLLLRVRRLKGPFVLVNLLDALSDVTLLYSYMLSPNIKDATEIAHNVRALRHRLTHGSQSYSARSKLAIEVPDTLCGVFAGTTVETHSKVSVRIDPDSFLSGVLSVRSLGILPSVSALWEVIPFSFVYDWFTGLGTNMERVETSILMLSVEVLESTHSSLLTYVLPQELLESKGLYASDSASLSRPRYCIYNREALSTLPMPCPTRLPYFGPTGIPGLGSTAALTWKVLRRG